LFLLSVGEAFSSLDYSTGPELSTTFISVYWEQLATIGKLSPKMPMKWWNPLLNVLLRSSKRL
jgi:hypothetical protein